MRKSEMRELVEQKILLTGPGASRELRHGPSKPNSPAAAEPAGLEAPAEAATAWDCGVAAVAQDRGDPGAIGHAAGPDRAGEEDLLLDQLAHLGLSHLVAPSRGRYREKTRARRDSFSELGHGPSKPNSPAAELPEPDAPDDAAAARGWLLIVVAAVAPAVVTAGFRA